MRPSRSFDWPKRTTLHQGRGTTHLAMPRDDAPRGGSSCPRALGPSRKLCLVMLCPLPRRVGRPNVRGVPGVAFAAGPPDGGRRGNTSSFAASRDLLKLAPRRCFYAGERLREQSECALGALTWSAVINRTSRAGERRSAPSGPDDWHRVTGKKALAPGVRVRRERAVKYTRVHSRPRGRSFALVSGRGGLPTPPP